MAPIRKLFLDTLLGQVSDRNPIWLMRQAGRYLPEYKKIRGEADGFLNFCLTPRLAFEAVLQPMRRYNFDAAILFADILLIPHALGVGLDYKENLGPVLSPVQKESDLLKLVYDRNIITPVFQTMDLMKSRLPHSTTRLGFCGGLWTVACYMIDGTSKEGFKGALNSIKHQPDFVARLMDILHEATFDYLSGQIEAGAEAIQIFDSWAGLLSDQAFRTWVIDPTRRLVQALENRYPTIPILGFPRGATPADYCAYVNETGVDALSIDSNIPLSFAKKELQTVKPVQGNLNPEVLRQGGDLLRAEVATLLDTMGPGLLFNLGHGVLPDTPPENVAELVKLVREAQWEKV